MDGSAGNDLPQASTSGADGVDSQPQANPPLQTTDASIRRYDPAECEKEIDATYANVLTNQEEYDKQLLTLSAGYLVLLMSFIKDIVPLNSAIWRVLLYSSFGLLAGCTILVLVSYQVSIHGHFAAKDFWENQKVGDGKRLYPYKFATFLRVLNLLTGLAFCLGIIFSVMFVVINIHHEATMTPQPTAVRTFNPVPPSPGLPMNPPPPPSPSKGR
jgi:hypothetical protein